MMSKKGLRTRWGKVRINNCGYPCVRTKQGYRSLHRLVWTQHYNHRVPEGYEIHHLNADKKDFRIQNLQCVRSDLHRRFHQQKTI